MLTKKRLDHSLKYISIFFTKATILEFIHSQALLNLEAVAQRCSIKCSLKKFAKPLRKHLCRGLFNKDTGWRPVTILEKLQHRCLSVILRNFSEHLFCRTLAASVNLCSSLQSFSKKQFLDLII